MPELGTLQIVKAGPQSTVQDFGRFGYGSLGLSRGGPLDEHAFAWANHLVMNRLNTPAIEISMGGFEARFCADTWIAVTGPDMDLSINGRKAEQWKTHFMKEGSVLKLKGGVSGMRTYLAVSGGFSVEEVLGSCSRSIRDSSIGIAVALKKGDRVRFQKKSNPLLEGFIRRTPWDCIPSYSQQMELSFIPGGLWITLSEQHRSMFLKGNFEISMDSDRMGYRFKGHPMPIENRNSFQSEGIGRGTIQIPPDGNPIVMLNDHQTIGGYPIFGCLTHGACNRLAQGRPGEKVRFVTESLAPAQQKRIEFLKYFTGLSSSF